MMTQIIGRVRAHDSSAEFRRSRRSSREPRALHQDICPSIGTDDW